MEVIMALQVAALQAVSSSTVSVLLHVEISCSALVIMSCHAVPRYMTVVSY